MSTAVALALALFRFIGFFTEPSLSSSEIHAIDGQRSGVVRPVAQDRPLRVITWNIERGVRYPPVESLLKELDADVVLLQEVDRFCSRSGHRNVTQELAVALQMNWVSAGEFQEIGEGRRGRACVSGQAVLSRMPIDDASVVQFADQASLKWRLNPAQPRRGARIALRASTLGLVFYSVHLESGGNEDRRGRQVRDIVADASTHHGAAIVGGDFNNVGDGRSTMFAPLAAAGFINATHGGEAARRPIDWIFLRELGGTAAVVRAPDASDHDPLVVAIERPARSGR